MDWSFVPILLVALTVWALAYRYFRTRQAGKAGAAKPKVAETTSQALHRLSGAIETFVESSAHPRELYEQSDFLAATKLLAGADVSFDLLRQYATGASWPLACAALHVLAKRPERDSLRDAVLGRLHQMRPWTLYFALRYFNSLASRPAVGEPAAQARHWWYDNIIIVDAFREYFEERVKLGDVVTFGGALAGVDGDRKDHIGWLLQRVDHPTAVLLRAELARWSETQLDRTFLSTIGRFWTYGIENDVLVTPDEWRDRMVEACATILKPTPPRSVLVCGEPRVGKTSFLTLLSRVLSGKGWQVFEASAAELMAGQMYIGQLEERIKKLVTELNAAKKVVLYVPDFLQVAESGRHQGQTASILDQISQAMTSGDLVIVSEASPSGVVRLFQTRPSLKSAMQLVRFEPMNEKATADLARAVAAKIKIAFGVKVGPDAVDAVLHLSHQYLGSTQLPGIALDLMKRSASHAVSAGRKSVGSEDVLETLSQLSGLPRLVLDDNQRLDLGAVKSVFTKRVIGQDEAVGAIVDRIAMLKAGLIDPKRPIGVFLFAGPTGTGKTELAKTLASYLFGSPDRMARLDMSEVQTADSTSKILGAGSGETDSLADKVRKQPFSVVLLDEFEKAHSNAWDLFLQVFDDGRLTDAMGRTVDFRHTIIILTSNLGATTHVADGIGFARRQGAYSENQILRAIGATFRPEFVNRLDKVIVFRPLSRDYMRQILEKELEGVLERRGLRQRDWAVEYEDSAISFLLDKGFTTDMGARPLRRAIDEYLLAPLAATMVEHRYPAGDQFLFVKSDGKAIQVEFVDPDAGDPAPMPALGEADSASLLARAIIGASGSPDESRALAETVASIDGRLKSPEWCGLNDTLSAAIAEPGIWQREDRAGIFSRYELMARVLEARQTAERLQARLDSGLTKQGKISRELVARLALQLHLIKLGIEDVLSDAPVDALVSVEAVAAGSNARSDVAEKWCAHLASMYRGWSQKRNMRLREIAASRAPVLEITGFGAFRVLGEEAGLHVWEEGDGTRAVARVRVASTPVDDTASDLSLQVLERLLDAAGDGRAIVRRYRRSPDMLVRDAHKGWRSGKLDAVLAGDFDLIGLLSE